MSSTDRAKLEHQLAIAHRALTRAREAADNMSDNTVYLDLTTTLVTVTRLAENSLRGKGRSQIAGQTEFPTTVFQGSR